MEDLGLHSFAIESFHWRITYRCEKEMKRSSMAKAIPVTRTKRKSTKEFQALKAKIRKRSMILQKKSQNSVRNSVNVLRESERLGKEDFSIRITQQ
jgi:hypothetical protein